MRELNRGYNESKMYENISKQTNKQKNTYPQFKDYKWAQQE